ncbi:MAG: hypothetical protein FWE03_07165 [Firmicutes bacterium]|nr:hypothetical protein [Bacillota bacterium]
MDCKKEKIKDFFIKCFYSIIHAEEKVLESVSSGKLTTNEVHLISAVFRAKAVGKNTFSIIAKMLDVTLGTLTTSFNRLAKKGYLKKVPHEIDKRKFYIEPSDLAIAIHNEHVAFHDKMFSGIINSISEDQLEIVIDSLEKLNKFFMQLK